MNLYVLDTDHLSLYGRNHPKIVNRLRASQGQIATTAINVEEQLRGRLAQIDAARKNAKDVANLCMAYQLLVETMLLLSEFQVLQYNTDSYAIYQSLKANRLRVGAQDLRIASVALAHEGILLTRNIQDFEKIPNLAIQDWSV
ncbi:type II toxin-antitoxin system VapC family toxin [Pseudanabaena sp. PCC 6802]|uniref:type II toxin-antitoxin system VapC family toxin n=1 Tax=Pseudanabaena sp. PCC 6802 TaxID=118173 RepID=UPI00034B95F1|nr:type II toxin-antitoxin system VapC family toxin [Pseudanabaena sp. PCC 6802]